MSNGRGIQVPGKLFVSRFPAECEDHDLRQVFEPFGEIIDLVILRKDKKISALIKYADVDYCDAAIRSLHGQKIMPGGEGPLKVEFASGEIERLQIQVNYSHLPDPDALSKGGTSIQQFAPGPTKLFVGALPKDSGEDALTNLFYEFGELVEVHIIKDKQGGHTGSAFVKFADPQAAKQAIDFIHGSSPLDGQTRPLEVRMADADSKPSKKGMSPALAIAGRGGVFAGQGFSRPPPPPPRAPPPAYHPPPRTYQPVYAPPSRALTSPSGGEGGYKLFVAALPFAYTEREIDQIFAKYGRLVEVHIMRDKGGKSKGCAFVRFQSYESAQWAIGDLDKTITLEGQARPMEVRFAPDGAGGAANGPGGKGHARYSPY